VPERRWNGISAIKLSRDLPFSVSERGGALALLSSRRYISRAFPDKAQGSARAPVGGFGAEQEF
jgi:hypothetical protein